MAKIRVTREKERFMAITLALTIFVLFASAYCAVRFHREKREEKGRRKETETHVVYLVTEISRFVFSELRLTATERGLAINNNRTSANDPNDFIPTWNICVTDREENDVVRIGFTWFEMPQVNIHLTRWEGAMSWTEVFPFRELGRVIEIARRHVASCHGLIPTEGSDG